jgi:hypothetical protein
MSATIYYHLHGGKILAHCPAGPDPGFEKQLDRQGLHWETYTSDEEAPPHEHHIATDADGDGKVDSYQPIGVGAGVAAVGVAQSEVSALRTQMSKILAALEKRGIV